MEELKMLALKIQLFAEDGASENPEAVDTPTGQTTDASTEDAENKGTENSEKETKTFTQEQVNKIVEGRLAKAKKDMPTDDEMKDYKAWKESQKTEEEKKAEQEKKNKEVISERDNLKQENLMLKLGVNVADMDYVQFKVAKMDGDFEDNLKDYLKENPKYVAATNEPKPTKTVDLGNDHNDDNNDADDAMIDRLMGIKR